MSIPSKIHGYVAQAIMWLVKPELAPLLGDMYVTQQQLKKRKVDWGDLIVDPKGRLIKVENLVKTGSKKNLTGKGGNA